MAEREGYELVEGVRLLCMQPLGVLVVHDFDDQRDAEHAYDNVEQSGTCSIEGCAGEHALTACRVLRRRNG